LADNHVNVDMIVQSASSAVKKTDISFSVSRENIDKAVGIINKIKGDLKFHSVDALPNVAKISVVGMAMRTQPGVAKTMFETLAAKGVNLHVISTSEIKISVLVDAEYTELAVRSLHTAFGLDDES
jgi:aspartate kinase